MGLLFGKLRRRGAAVTGTVPGLTFISWRVETGSWVKELRPPAFPIQSWHYWKCPCCWGRSVPRCVAQWDCGEFHFAIGIDQFPKLSRWVLLKCHKSGQPSALSVVHVHRRLTASRSRCAHRVFDLSAPDLTLLQTRIVKSLKQGLCHVESLL